MTLKDILVCLDPTEAGERRLRLAAAIAREYQAHVSAAYILSEAIPGVPPYQGVGIPAPTGATEIAQGSIVAGVPLPGAPPLSHPPLRPAPSSPTLSSNASVRRCSHMALTATGTCLAAVTAKS